MGMPVRPTGELIGPGPMSFPVPRGLIRMAPSKTYFAVAPTITRADIPALCADLAGRVRGRGSGVVVCDVAEVVRPDVVTVEAVARLCLTARRHGWTLFVHGAGSALLGLVSLLGLTGVVTPVRPAARRAETAGRCRGSW
jgi:hypothetical protein